MKKEDFEEMRINRLSRPVASFGVEDVIGRPIGSAWASYYRYGDSAPAGTPRAFGIVALKAELIFNGFSKGIVPLVPAFGDAMRNRVKEFQTSVGRTADGVIGPSTAQALFSKRIKLNEELYEIPDKLICKQISLESGFDPAAVGYVDARDRGLAQINSGAHPEVSDVQAFDPGYSIPWTTRYLSSNINYCNGDVKAGVAAHNIGNFYAKRWQEAGKPAEGLLTVGGKDYAAIATRYVSLVYARPC